MRSLWPAWALAVLCCATYCKAQIAPAHVALATYATASYKDQHGNSFSTHSPQAFAVVRQVYGLSVRIDPETNWRTVPPGAWLNVRCTLRNTGNGIDRYQVSFVQESIGWSCLLADESFNDLPARLELDRGRETIFYVRLRAPWNHVPTDGLIGELAVSSSGSGTNHLQLYTSWRETVAAGREGIIYSGLWNTPHGPEPLVAAGADTDRLYVATSGGKLLVGSGLTKDLSTLAVGVDLVGEPVSIGNWLAWTTQDGRLLLLNASDLTNPFVRVAAPPNGAPVAFQPAVYQSTYLVVTADKRLYRLTREGGWQAYVPLGLYPPSTPLLVSGGHIFFGTANGEIVCLDAGSLQFRWQDRVSPVGITGRLRISGDGRQILFYTANGTVSSYDVASRSVRWSRRLPGPVLDSATAGLSGAFFLCEDRRIYGFNSATGAVLPGFPTVAIPGGSALIPKLVVATRDEADAPAYLWLVTAERTGYAFCSRLGLNYYRFQFSPSGSFDTVLPPVLSPGGMAVALRDSTGSNGWNRGWIFVYRPQ